MKPSPWRVLHVIPSLETGGAERALLYLLERLDRTRFCCTVLCLKTAGDWAEDAQRLGIDVVVARVRGWWDLPGLLRVARVIRRAGPNLVHSHLFPANLILRVIRLLRNAFGLAAFRLVTSEHTLEMERTSERIINRMSWRLADRVVAVSDSVAAYARRTYGVSAARIRTIRNGVGLISGSVTRPSNGRAVITCVGRLEQVKGQDLLLRAVAMLPPDLRDRVELLFLGEGSEAANLAQLAEDLDLAKQTRWAGKCSDPAPFYLQATCVVVPSRHEGLGYSALEAMAAGRPVIATGVGGLVEAIEDDVTGLLIAPGDPGAMAAAIQALLVNPERAEKMGAAGRERMAHEFSVERMVTETESLYDELLVRAPG